MNKSNNRVLLFTILKLFKPLSKRAHGRFFGFLKYLFNTITNTWPNRDKNKIKGIKLVINGKLKGKARSSSLLIKSGSIPLQTLNNPIEYIKGTSFTSMGTFGFKLWLTKS